MVIGVGMMSFRLNDCHSLKEKRKIVKSIIARIRNEFNASVAEVDFNDVHQRAEIGFALVGNDRRVINSKIDKLVEFTDQLSLAEMIDSNTEMINI